jgi:hypothetical protein
MVTGKTPPEPGKRQRQILEKVQRLGEASVAAARRSAADAPSYIAARSMPGLLAKNRQSE